YGSNGERHARRYDADPGRQPRHPVRQLEGVVQDDQSRNADRSPNELNQVVGGPAGALGIQREGSRVVVGVCAAGVEYARDYRDDDGGQQEMGRQKEGLAVSQGAGSSPDVWVTSSMDISFSPLLSCVHICWRRRSDRRRRRRPVPPSSAGRAAGGSPPGV